MHKNWKEMPQKKEDLGIFVELTEHFKQLRQAST